MNNFNGIVAAVDDEYIKIWPKYHSNSVPGKIFVNYSDINSAEVILRDNL